MASEAQPFILLARMAEAALTEATAALADAGAEPDARESAHTQAVLALEKISLLSRRYSATREFRDRMAGHSIAPTPIASTPAFRAALESLAARVEYARDVLGTTAAGRISKSLRTWQPDSALDHVLTLGTQADGAARSLKRRRMVPV